MRVGGKLEATGFGATELGEETLKIEEVGVEECEVEAFGRKRHEEKGLGEGELETGKAAGVGIEQTKELEARVSMKGSVGVEVHEAERYKG